jgi:hypothetical protein
MRCHTIALHTDGLGEQTRKRGDTYAYAYRRYVQGDIRCHTIGLRTRTDGFGEQTRGCC